MAGTSVEECDEKYFSRNCEKLGGSGQFDAIPSLRPILLTVLAGLWKASSSSSSYCQWEKGAKLPISFLFPSQQKY